MPGPRPAPLLLVLLALLAHAGRGSPARPVASRTTARGPTLGRAMPLETLVGADARDGQQQQPMGSFVSTARPLTTADGAGSTVGSTVGSTSGSSVDSTSGSSVGSTSGSSVGSTSGGTDGSSTVGSTTMVSTTVVSTSIGGGGSTEDETTAATSTTALASANETEADAAATATPTRRRHHDGHSNSKRRDQADAASSKSLDMGGVGVRSQYDAPEEAPLRKAMLRVVLLPHHHDDDDQDGGEDGVDARAVGHPAKHVRSRMMALPHGPPEPEADAQPSQPGAAPRKPHAVPMVRIVSSQQIRVLSDDPASRPGIMLSYDNDPDSSVVFTSRRKHTEVQMPSAVLRGKAAADGVHHNSKLIFTIEHNSEAGENGTGRSDGQSILLQDTMVVPASGGVPVSMAFAMPSPMLSGVSSFALPNPAAPPAQDLQQQQPAEAAVVTAQPAVSPASFEVQPAALPDPETSSAGPSPPAAPPAIQPASPQAVQPAAPPAVQPAAPPAVQPASPQAVQPVAPPAVQPAALPAVQPAALPIASPAAAQAAALPTAPPAAVEPLTDPPSFVAPADPPQLLSPPPTLNPQPAAVGLDAAVPSSQPPPAPAPAPAPGVEDGLAPPPGAPPPHAFPFAFPPSPFGLDAPPPGPVRSRMMHQPGHPDGDDGHDPHDATVLSRAMSRDHDEDSDKSRPKLGAHMAPAPDAARHPAARWSATPVAATTRRPASSSSTASTATASASTGHSAEPSHSKEDAKSTAMARRPAVSQLGHSAGAPTTTTTVGASSNSSTRATPPATPRRPGRTTRLPAAG